MPTKEFLDQQQFRRNLPPVSAREMNALVKEGCSDPKCTVPAEDHEEMQITANCHPDERFVEAFYDRVTQEICFACAVCGKGIIKLAVK